MSGERRSGGDYSRLEYTQGVGSAVKAFDRALHYSCSVA